MTVERPDHRRPDDIFGFTHEEQLANRVSDARLRALLDDEQTIIHRVEESSNDYGEWLFITISRGKGEQQHLVTFYGLGEHERRERWLLDEWFWYRANPFRETLEQQISREEAEALIQQRRDDIAPYVDRHPQTKHGRIFEFLADLSDEDGAAVEIEDLGDIADWLADDLE